jgi:quinol monooxygenase YgiN
MQSQISWHVELMVKPGRLDDFRTLTGEMVTFAKGEPGVLIYERHLSEDGETVHVYERYSDSAAAVAHLRAFTERFGARFARMVDRKSFKVYGAPSAELRALLDGFGAVYSNAFAGFSR